MLSERIFSLISDKHHDEARSLINQEQKRFPEGEAHRFTAFSAVLHEDLGEIDKAVALMRRALQQKPAWLPHFYRLSVLLMDAKHWDEADVVLSELVALSLAQNDAYFLNEARFRRAVCLMKLGRLKEFRQVKGEIPIGMTAFIGDKLCRVDDIA